MKDVPDILGLTESTLYPLLKRLEKAECLTAYSVEHNGRLRKYYRLTPTGEERIAEFLSEQADIMSIYDFAKQVHNDDQAGIPIRTRTGAGQAAARRSRAGARVLR